MVGTIEFCLRVLGLLFGAMLLSIVLELIGTLCFWPDQGWHHSQTMLQSELGWLSSHFKSSLLMPYPAQSTAKILRLVHEWLVIRPGWVQYADGAQQLSNNYYQDLFGQSYGAVIDYLLAAVFTIFTFIVRLVVLTLAFPLFLLAGITGGVDGLMRRDLRKFRADRESSFVYHRARRTLIPLMLTPWFIYLSLPWSINPIWILLPCAALFGLMISTTTATFKKYL